MMNGFGLNNIGVFSQNYKILPIRKDQEGSGMIILCRSALEKISILELQYPLMFNIQNKKCHPPKVMHCGVQDFCAPEGIAYAPRWMMKNLGLAEQGAIATIQSVTLPSATFIQLQPQSVAFLDISNPKAVLEQVLRKYPTLTKGSTILFHYNDKEYYMKVLDIKPQSSSNAVSILNADVEVDFAPPVGYVEPEMKKPTNNSNASVSSPNRTNNGSELDDVDPLQTSYSSFEESSTEEDDFAGDSSAGPKSMLLSQLSNKKKPKLLPIVGSNGSIEMKPEAEVQELRESQKKALREREEKARKEEEERLKKQEDSKKNMLAFSGKGETIR
jgi:ubiquitin fusion degradation protein 1